MKNKNSSIIFDRLHKNRYRKKGDITLVGGGGDIDLEQITKLGATATRGQTEETFISDMNNFVDLKKDYIIRDSEVIIDNNGNTFERDVDYDIDFARARIMTLSEGSMSNASTYSISYKYIEPSIVEIELEKDEFHELKRIPLEVLRFIQGEQNIVKTIATFDNSDEDDFETQSYVEFDGSMRLKNNYNYDLDLTGEVYVYYVDYENKKIIFDSNFKEELGIETINDIEVKYLYEQEQKIEQLTLNDNTLILDNTPEEGTVEVYINDGLVEPSGYLYETEIDLTDFKEIDSIQIVSG